VAEANIEVDVIIQNISKDGKTDFSFTVHRNDYAKTVDLLKKPCCLPWVLINSWVTPRSARSALWVSACEVMWGGQQNVPLAERRGHQHPDDFHQRNQDLGGH
jgi:hypothetical protein